MAARLVGEAVSGPRARRDISRWARAPHLGAHAPVKTREGRLSRMHCIRSAFRSMLALPRLAAVVALAAVAFGAAAGVASAKEVEIVSQGEPPATLPRNVHYFKTIQAAVNATKHGAHVLI